MRLLPVTKDHFSILEQLFQKRLEESRLLERSSVEDLMKKLHNGYDGRFMGAYVDSLESPKCCLVMAHFPGFVTQDISAHIVLIYVDPDMRGGLDIFKELIRAAENYARLNGAVALLGSSWIYRGSKPSDALWKRAGFEEQERTFIKHLN